MKRILFLVIVFVMNLSVSAQIADGSVAPNFTATDLDGNTHDLQTYLSQGKTVILNISATWCTPCWNYKETGALSDTYYAFGPEASDEVVILYVEGDPSTGLNELNGISGNTVGDWVSNTPFPILDNASIANDYQINFFPTIYRICPDGFVYEMGQLPNTGIRNSINSNCSGTLQGVNNYLKTSVDDIVLCEDGVSADFTFIAKNFGTNTASSLDADVFSGSNSTNVSQSLNNLSLYQSQDITVNATLDSNLAHSVTLNTVNGTSPHVSSFNSSTFQVSSTSSTDNSNITIEVTTDFYPGEITWALLDENGTSIASGGPYQPGTNDQWGGGGADAFNTFSYNVTLPSTEQCFSIEVYDSFGDGWSAFNSTTAQPGVEILSNGSALFSSGTPGNFGASLAYPSAFRYNQPLSNSEFENLGFSVYPNPSRGVINFNTSLALDVEVIDLNGKSVYNGLIENGQLDLSSLGSGIYLVKATFDKITKVSKLILN